MSNKIKIRARMQGELLDIKILMDHIMESGQRKDSAGQIVPAYFIQEVSVTVGGKLVLQSQFGPAVAKDPFLGLKVKGGKLGDKVTVAWTDSKGVKNSAEDVVA